MLTAKETEVMAQITAGLPDVSVAKIAALRGVDAAVTQADKDAALAALRAAFPGLPSYPVTWSDGTKSN